MSVWSIEFEKFENLLVRSFILALVTYICYSFTDFLLRLELVFLYCQKFDVSVQCLVKTHMWALWYFCFCRMLWEYSCYVEQTEFHGITWSQSLRSVYACRTRLPYLPVTTACLYYTCIVVALQYSKFLPEQDVLRWHAFSASAVGGWW